MINNHIYLFRAKFIKNRQLSLEFEKLSPEELLIRAINEKTSIETREGYTWHIGNIKVFNETSGSFAVGRKTISSLPKYDEETKDFVDELSQTSPYTVIYYDKELGILGITRNYILAPSEYSIAKKIEQLLQISSVVLNSSTHVEIDSIKNPVSLISRIKNAYAIKKFAVTFSGPNPFDADEHFHKPMSIYLQDANGKEGKTIIDGEELNSEVLIRMTHSVAATGNEVSARLKDTEKDKVVTVYLNKNPAKVILPKDLVDEEDIIRYMRDMYYRVRNI